jgi:hypothetical protein
MAETQSGEEYKQAEKLFGDMLDLAISISGHAARLDQDKINHMTESEQSAEKAQGQRLQDIVNMNRYLEDKQGNNAIDGLLQNVESQIETGSTLSSIDPNLKNVPRLIIDQYPRFKQFMVDNGMKPLEAADKETEQAYQQAREKFIEDVAKINTDRAGVELPFDSPVANIQTNVKDQIDNYYNRPPEDNQVAESDLHMVVTQDETTKVNTIHVRPDKSKADASTDILLVDFSGQEGTKIQAPRIGDAIAAVNQIKTELLTETGALSTLFGEKLSKTLGEKYNQLLLENINKLKNPPTLDTSSIAASPPPAEVEAAPPSAESPESPLQPIEAPQDNPAEPEEIANNQPVVIDAQAREAYYQEHQAEVDRDLAEIIEATKIITRQLQAQGIGETGLIIDNQMAGLGPEPLDIRRIIESGGLLDLTSAEAIQAGKLVTTPEGIKKYPGLARELESYHKQLLKYADHLPKPVLDRQFPGLFDALYPNGLPVQEANAEALPPISQEIAPPTPDTNIPAAIEFKAIPDNTLLTIGRLGSETLKPSVLYLKEPIVLADGTEVTQIKLFNAIGPGEGDHPLNAAQVRLVDPAAPRSETPDQRRGNLRTNNAGPVMSNNVSYFEVYDPTTHEFIQVPFEQTSLEPPQVIEPESREDALRRQLDEINGELPNLNPEFDADRMNHLYREQADIEAELAGRTIDSSPTTDDDNQNPPENLTPMNDDEPSIAADPLAPTTASPANNPPPAPDLQPLTDDLNPPAAPAAVHPGLVIVKYNKLEEVSADNARKTLKTLKPIAGLWEGYASKVYEHIQGGTRLERFFKRLNPRLVPESIKQYGEYFKDSWDRWSKGREGRFQRIFETSWFKNKALFEIRNQAIGEKRAAGTWAADQSIIKAREETETEFFEDWTEDQRQAARDQAAQTLSGQGLRSKLGLLGKLFVGKKGLNRYAVAELTRQKLTTMAQNGEIPEVELQKQVDQTKVTSFSQNPETWIDTIHQEAGEQAYRLDETKDNEKTLANRIRELVAKKLTEPTYDIDQFGADFDQAILNCWPDGSSEADFAKKLAGAEYFASALEELASYYRAQADHALSAEAIQNDLASQAITLGFAVPGERTKGELLKGEEALAKFEKIGINPVTATNATAMFLMATDLVGGGRGLTNMLGRIGLTTAVVAAGPALGFAVAAGTAGAIGASTLLPLGITAGVATLTRSLQSYAQTRGRWFADQRRRESGGDDLSTQTTAEGWANNLRRFRESTVGRFMLGDTEARLLNRLNVPKKTYAELLDPLRVYADTASVSVDTFNLRSDLTEDELRGLVDAFTTAEAYNRTNDRQRVVNGGVAIIKADPDTNLDVSRTRFDITKARCRSQLTSQLQGKTAIIGTDTPEQFLLGISILKIDAIEHTSARSNLSQDQRDALIQLDKQKTRAKSGISRHAAGQGVRAGALAAGVGTVLLEVKHLGETASGVFPDQRTPLQQLLSGFRPTSTTIEAPAIPVDPDNNFVSFTSDGAQVVCAPAGAEFIENANNNLDLRLPDGTLIEDIADSSGTILVDQATLDSHNLLVDQDSLPLATGNPNTVTLDSHHSLQVPGDNFSVDTNANSITINIDTNGDGIPDSPSTIDQAFTPDHRLSEGAKATLAGLGIETSETPGDLVIGQPATTTEYLSSLPQAPDTKPTISGLPQNFLLHRDANGLIDSIEVQGQGTIPVSEVDGLIVFNADSTDAIQKMGLDFDPTSDTTTTYETVTITTEPVFNADGFPEPTPEQASLMGGIHRDGWIDHGTPDTIDKSELGLHVVGLSPDGESVIVTQAVKGWTEVTSTQFPGRTFNLEAADSIIKFNAIIDDPDIDALDKDLSAITFDTRPDGAGRVVAEIPLSSGVFTLDADGKPVLAIEHLTSSLVTQTAEQAGDGRMHFVDIAAESGIPYSAEATTTEVEVPQTVFDVPTQTAIDTVLVAPPITTTSISIAESSETFTAPSDWLFPVAVLPPPLTLPNDPGKEDEDEDEPDTPPSPAPYPYSPYYNSSESLPPDARLQDIMIET